MQAHSTIMSALNHAAEQENKSRTCLHYNVSACEALSSASPVSPLDWTVVPHLWTNSSIDIQYSASQQFKFDGTIVTVTLVGLFQFMPCDIELHTACGQAQRIQHTRQRFIGSDWVLPLCFLLSLRIEQGSRIFGFATAGMCVSTSVIRIDTGIFESNIPGLTCQQFGLKHQKALGWPSREEYR